MIKDKTELINIVAEKFANVEDVEKMYILGFMEGVQAEKSKILNE